MAAGLTGRNQDEPQSGELAQPEPIGQSLVNESVERIQPSLQSKPVAVGTIPIPRLFRILRDQWRRNADYIIATLIALAGLAYAIPEHHFVAQLRNAVGWDDGYTIALADRLIDGRWLPYVDGLSHRGPLLYWATALSNYLMGRLSWVGPRWLVILSFFVAAAGCFGAGVAARRPLAGAVATVFYVFVICAALPAPGTLCLTGEKVSAPFCMASLMLTAMAIERARSTKWRVILLALAGVAVALAGLAKQTALLLVGPLAIWSIAAALARPQLRLRDRWLEAVALVAGWFATFCLALTPYALTGNLGAFYYWFVEYNAKIYMQPYRGIDISDEISRWWLDSPWLYFGMLTLVLWRACRGISTLFGPWPGAASSFTSVGFEVTAALSAAVSFVSAAAALRMWPHYFAAVASYFGLLIGLGAEQTLRSSERRQRLLAAALGGALLVLVVGRLTMKRYQSMVEERKAGGWPPSSPDPICGFIDRHSRPNQKLFVWGFDGDLYITCKRHPATSFTYLTLVAGIVPPFWEDARPERVAAGSRQRLVRELRQALPPIILDAPQRIGGFSIEKIPELQPTLGELYCRGPRLMGNAGREVTAYLRRGNPECP